MKRLVCLVFLGSTALLAAQGDRPSSIDWPYWGANQAQEKYSAAAQITRGNVNNLALAWRWEAGEKPLPEFNMRPGGFEATPIMIDDVVYVSTGYHRVIALNAETGQQIWAFDPRTYAEGPPVAGTGPHRGVMWWRDGNDMRILIAARNRLYAVDAKTGQPVKQFGGEGNVRLDLGHSREIPQGQFQSTSPGVVYGNLVIVGSRIPDRFQYTNDPPGSVQAFDVRTGKRAWIFHTIPTSATEFGADTWGNDSWKTVGHANVWGPLALDERRGLVYAATSTMSGDYWGGQRPGANLFAETLLCLDARTGKRVWHFQAVHHGIWDWDFASPPNLVTINVDGRQIDAVAQLSKQGFLYVFDRVTGQPVWPIEERPVDTKSEIPGEQPYPTQPFPTKPPPMGPQGVSLDDANDLTPEIRKLAQEQMKRYKLGPMFTPPTFAGLLQRPSNNGVSNWGGGAVDPETGVLYLRASDTYFISEICKNDRSDPYVDVAYGNFCGSTGLFTLPTPPGSKPAGNKPAAPERPRGSPELVEPELEIGRGGGSARATGVANPLGPIPLTKPPYAYLQAVDLNRGEFKWRTVFGEGSPAMRNHRLLKGVELPDRLGTPGNSGVAVTKGGLVFIGGGEPYLYAFDKMTGRELWRGSTQGRTAGNPITYQTRSGRQFVVISVGGGTDAALVGFALKPGGASSSTASGAAQQTSAPATASAPTMTGQEAYTSVCAACHGPTAAGGMGPRLAGANRDVSEVLAIVREGKGQMPPMSENEISDANLGRIVEYLRTLGGGGR
jgi:quinoprotein glucose dehydrogenase